MVGSSPAMTRETREERQSSSCPPLTEGRALTVGREEATVIELRRDGRQPAVAALRPHSSRLSGSSTIRLNARSQFAPNAPSTTR